jgi:hypothetical protein
LEVRFSSVIVIPHVLTFPDVFTPMGFFGAGPQSSAWLYLAWRSGLSIALLVYAFPTTDESMEHASDHSPQAAIIWAVLIIIVGVGTLTWVATAGQDLLPRLMLEGRISPLTQTINGMIALTNILTLLLLWTRGRSVLDLWLMVAAWELLGTGAMIALFVTDRFTFGFYAVRIISLVVQKPC